MFGMVAKLLGGGLVESVGGLVKTVFGDRSARDRYAADDQAALRQEFAAEFTGPERRGWWNSLVDGLNRLVRPFFTFGTVALFAWCAIDPISFTLAMQALALVPDPLWIILGTIVAFWFGGKTLEGMKASGLSAAQLKAVLSSMMEIQALRPAPPSPPMNDNAPMPDADFQSEMADTKRPMSNAAILEWNRRRQAGWRP